MPKGIIFLYLSLFARNQKNRLGNTQIPRTIPLVAIAATFGPLTATDYLPCEHFMISGIWLAALA